LLHGTREWGFEEQPDGSVKFFTHGISVEDTFAAEQGAKDGEKKFWSAWVDGIENYANTNGGSVVEGTRVINQTQGPSGNQLWETLSPAQQGEIRASQISGHQREANWLQDQFDSQAATVSDIRNINSLSGINRVFDAIEAGDTRDILRTMRNVIRNNEDSTDSRVQRALEDLEAIHSDIRTINNLANEHRTEAEDWATR